MKKLVLGILFFVSLLNAASVVDIRKNQMTPLIKCDSSGICDGKNAQDIRISLGDHNVTAIVCKDETNCGGITAAEARMKGLTPVVICKVNQDCGNISFGKASIYGVKPVVPCNVSGRCNDGVNAIDVRINQMTLIVFCTSGGECI
ncbi:hypothetical protein [Poseidonibacter ostreae]|uniref:Uncharacterized protein n=1 Tax=Poseidonibacter ostreae TaxID=2654171 RepID=A0A6L4WV17_9BACT|nr:hypothetical protein [Poseidonibacter ostreae]KAB7890295.1 hypothetical protein GBG19_03425 [Poseidonibacter ostreae]